MKKYLFVLGLIAGLLLACQSSKSTSGPEKEESATIVPDALPLNNLDLSSAQLPPNWQQVGGASSDLEKEKDLQIEEGTGVLVCREDGEHFNTGIEHGDIELDIMLMVPKNSNSGIYFQGRYEVQILDSWKKETVGSGDLGGIYASWVDEANGEKTGGSAPSVNASKAPGLWQHFNILFRAPKFDKNGVKVKNATFEHVYLNGHLVQKNVEVDRPTIAAMLDGEAATGPIMIQGDHGPVAFKEIKYKKMGSDTVVVSDIDYALYDGHWDYIPDFDKMTPKKTGTTSSLNELEELAGQKDHFGFVFTAEIEIPKDGDYLFTTVLDDGGDLFIDSTLLVHNLGEPGIGEEHGIINLTKGKHQLKLTYFEEVWLALAVIYVEGPEMPKRELASLDISKLWSARRGNFKQLVNTNDAPELVRGFVDYKGGKKTHALTVGDPSNVHYSYDLMDGAILKGWRGNFADVTNMWVNRGASQTLLPQNAVAEFSDGVPIAKLNNAESAWPDFRSTDYKNKGFRLDDAGRPAFLSSYKDVEIEDMVQSSGEGSLIRTVNFNSEATLNNYFFRLASAKNISKLSNGLYSVDGLYYLKLDDDSKISIRNQSEGDELVAAVGNQLRYELIW